MRPLAVSPLDPCPFCEYLHGKVPCAFISRGDLVSTFMNRAQYEKGALLVVPNIHLESILELDTHLTQAIYSEAHNMGRLLIDALGATGLGIFQNNGTSAGQTVPHLHVHVIPRYDSSKSRRFFDENFPITPNDELETLAAHIRRVRADTNRE